MSRPAAGGRGNRRRCAAGLTAGSARMKIADMVKEGREPGFRPFSTLGEIVADAGLKLRRPAGKPQEPAGQKPERAEPPDEELFRQAMDGVARASWRRNVAAAAPPEPQPRADPGLEERRLMEAALAGDPALTVQDHPEYIEGWIGLLFRELLGIELSLPFAHLPYSEAMDRFGTDRPDTRYELYLVDVTDIVAGSEFRVFRQAVERGGVVKAIRVPDGARLSRKELDELIEYVKVFGAQGMAWIKVQADGWQSPVTKFLSGEVQSGLAQRMGIQVGDLLLFVADQSKIVHDALANVRIRLAQHMGLIDAERYEFVWITHFPLLEWDHEEKRYASVHHPFTAPLEEDLDLLESQPERVRSRAYDLVLNGTEVGGGSIRIHRQDVQKRVFAALGIGEEEAAEKFGFLLEALQHGAPPHGGIAFGFDRLIMLLGGLNSIREVIAFPKTQKATCLLSGAPAEPEIRQLLELCVRVEKERRS